MLSHRPCQGPCCQLGQSDSSCNTEYKQLLQTEAGVLCEAICTITVALIASSPTMAVTSIGDTSRAVSLGSDCSNKVPPRLDYTTALPLGQVPGIACIIYKQDCIHMCACTNVSHGHAIQQQITQKPQRQYCIIMLQLL